MAKFSDDHEERRRQFAETWLQKFYRDVNDRIIQLGIAPDKHPCDPSANEVYDRSIFVKIHQEIYPISCEVLIEVFSRFGSLDCVERLSRGFHSTVRFSNKESTIRAFNSLNGRQIYEDCCQLELVMVKETTSPQIVEDSGEQELPYEFAKSSPTNLDEESAKTSNPQSEAEMVCEDSEEPSLVSNSEELSQEIDLKPQFFNSAKLVQIGSELEDSQDEIEVANKVSSQEAVEEPKEMEVSVPETTEDSLVVQNCRRFSKVISDSVCVTMPEVELQKTHKVLGTCFVHALNLEVMQGLTGFRMNPVVCLRILSAHQVFVEMPRRGDEWLTALLDGDISMSRYMEFMVILWPYDRGKLKLVRSEDRLINVFAAIDHEVALFLDPKGVVQEFESRMVIFGIISESLPFDRGREGIGVFDVQRDSDVCYHYFEFCFWLGSKRHTLISLPYDREKVMLSVGWNRVSGWVLVFDPGGLYPSLLGRRGKLCDESCVGLVDTSRVLGCGILDCCSGAGVAQFGLKFIKDDKTSMPFDRGRICVAQAALFGLKLFKEARVVFGNKCCFSPCVIAFLYRKNLVFDPGISTGQSAINSVLKCILVQLNQLERQPRGSYLWSNGSKFIKHIGWVVICYCCYCSSSSHISYCWTRTDILK